jgi:hypothetical protein
MKNLQSVTNSGQGQLGVSVGNRVLVAVTETTVGLGSAILFQEAVVSNNNHFSKDKGEISVPINVVSEAYDNRGFANIVYYETNDPPAEDPNGKAGTVRDKDHPEGNEINNPKYHKQHATGQGDTKTIDKCYGSDKFQLFAVYYAASPTPGLHKKGEPPPRGKKAGYSSGLKK